MSELDKAMNEAYDKYGHNAYFGNGFYAGFEYAKRKQSKKIAEMEEALKSIASTIVWTPVDPSDKKIIKAMRKVINKHYDIAKQALRRTER